MHFFIIFSLELPNNFKVFSRNYSYPYRSWYLSILLSQFLFFWISQHFLLSVFIFIFFIKKFDRLLFLLFTKTLFSLYPCFSITSFSDTEFLQLLFDFKFFIYNISFFPFITKVVYAEYLSLFLSLSLSSVFSLSLFQSNFIYKHISPHPLYLSLSLFFSTTLFIFPLLSFTFLCTDKDSN